MAAALRRRSGAWLRSNNVARVGQDDLVSRRDAILEQARGWLGDDPDPDTRAELEMLLAGDRAALAERFSGRLQFGTAGLRGELGAGPTRMNRVIVRRAAAGLVTYLADAVPEAPARGVLIGYDARHKSDVFAEDTAR